MKEPLKQFSHKLHVPTNQILKELFVKSSLDQLQNFRRKNNPRH